MQLVMRRLGWFVIGAILLLLTACNAEPKTVFVVVTATPEPALPTTAPPTAAPTQPNAPPTRTPLPPPQITAPPPPATPPPAPTLTNSPPPPPKLTAPPPPLIPTLPRTPTRTPTRPAGPPQLPSRFPPDGTFDNQNRTELDVSVVDAGYAANGMTQLTFEVLARVRGARNNGDGIDNVEFLINRVLPDGLLEEAYLHTENTAPYCAFQEETGTTCRRFQMRVGTLWLASDDDLITRVPMARGPHQLKINVTGKKGERWQRLYEFTVR